MPDFLDLSLYIAAAEFFGGGYLFFLGFRIWRRLRLMQDTPTSKIRSLALGRVELKGRAVAQTLLEAPITSTSCVYFHYRIAENRGNSWATLAKGESARPAFFLEDETGRVLVDPEGAKMQLGRPRYFGSSPAMHPALAALVAERQIDLEENLVFFEWRIDPGDSLYVLGTAFERSRRKRVADRIRAVKADPRALGAADLDGDGRVSAEEWERVRARVENAVDRAGALDRVVVAREATGATPFLISDRAESTIALLSHIKAFLGVFFGAALCLNGLHLLVRKLF